jgi:tetratricopeptide (TPR) repeat protein
METRSYGMIQGPVQVPEAIRVIQDALISPGAPSAPAVLAQLDRILNSTEFNKSIRMCRFLRLVTQEALNGNGAGLKEYRIGTEVFDKDESFDPRVDPIVRNEARRLRRKLEMYYLVEGKTDPVLIEMPKGGYTPVFGFQPVPVTEAPMAHLAAASASTRRGLVLPVAGLALAIAVAGWWLVVHRSRQVAGGPERNTAATEAYTLGKHLMFTLRIEDLIGGRAQLENAVRLDPSFTEAMGALAVNYQISTALGANRDEAVAKSRGLIARTSQLAPGSTTAELALAGDAAILQEDYAAGERHFRRAVASDPNDASVHAIYASSCLLPLGRIEDARREARRAVELAQSGLTMTVLVLTDYIARDYAAAIMHAGESLRRHMENEAITFLLIDSYIATKKWDEAWFFIEKQGIDTDAYRAKIRALKGDRGDALRVARERVERGGQPLVIARLLAVGGDGVAATRWLEQADRRHDHTARILASYDSDFDAMRGSAEFRSLLEAMRHPRVP